MNFKFYETLQKKIIPFVPIHDHLVNWYICGPTVYDVSHIGHARCYIQMDIHRRIIETYFNHVINLVMNITNVDDKIITRANKENIPFQKLADLYEKKFLTNLTELNIDYPSKIIRVTDAITHIIHFIEKLLKDEIAYISNDSVYFSLDTYKKQGYSGKLVDIAEDKSKARLAENPDKRNPADFALWKRSKRGEPGWNTPFIATPGRPGWHLECSAMIVNAFKNITNGRLDIHSGGADLKFPHHHNEVLQSTAFLELKDKKWCNNFIHYGQVNDKDGKKMSKSLGNFVSIDDFLVSGTKSPQFNALVLRMIFLTHNYVDQINFSSGLIEEATHIVNDFVKFLNNMISYQRLIKKSKAMQTTRDLTYLTRIKKIKHCIPLTLRNNFDTVSVITMLRELMTDINTYITIDAEDLKMLNPTVLKEAFSLIKNTLDNLGLEISIVTDKTSDTIDPKFIQTVVDFRAEIRKYAIETKSFDLMPYLDHLRDTVFPKFNLELRDIDKDTSNWMAYK